jgi:hypothetical protein
MQPKTKGQRRLESVGGVYPLLFLLAPIAGVLLWTFGWLFSLPGLQRNALHFTGLAVVNLLAGIAFILLLIGWARLMRLLALFRRKP